MWQFADRGDTILPACKGKSHQKSHFPACINFLPLLFEHLLWPILFLVESFLMSSDLVSVFLPTRTIRILLHPHHLKVSFDNSSMHQVTRRKPCNHCGLIIRIKLQSKLLCFTPKPFSLLFFKYVKTIRLQSSLAFKPHLVLLDEQLNLDCPLKLYLSSWLETIVSPRLVLPCIILLPPSIIAMAISD
jgi:hypothetical protein